MRVIGIAILVIGVIGAMASLAMDVSVAAGNGMRVNNIGLMADKQNYLIISGFVAISGLILTIFGDRFKSNSGSVDLEDKEHNPDISRLDGVPVKLGVTIFIICFVFIIGSILVFRS